MEKSVLVTYASKYGSTAGIAEKIGEVLRKQGLQGDVLPVKSVKDPGKYQAVVLGSAVYIGFWRKEAADFLKRNAEALSKQPVWLFSSGPTGEGDLETLLQGWKFPSGLQSVADQIHPREIVTFRGNANLQKMNFIEKWMMNRVGAAVGDFRDWDAVQSWAEGIVRDLV